eukprot:GHVQ01037982.1.p1 GENE.GHVQ01037982.1~~GHVQ01037982.1.p1  ORF type:complete len:176 (+),score=9.59 GHVQ01037982.1:27-530(+)
MTCELITVHHSPGILEVRQCNVEPLLDIICKSFLCAFLSILFLKLLIFKDSSVLLHLCWLSALLGAAYSLIRYNTPKEESMLVIADLGIQLQTLLFSGARRYYFVDYARIKDIVLNEGVVAHDIIFYLAILVQDVNKLIVPFEAYPPRLKDLLPVYKNLYSVIFGDD